jgi:hypothetical protein
MSFKLVKTGKSYGDQKDIPLSGMDSAESSSPLESYHPKYTTAQATREELEEIAERVRSEGYVLLWSTILQDLVAFYRDDEAKSKIPSGFVPYSDAELKELFGDNKPLLYEPTLRLIHEAKKCGGCIVGSSKNAQKE